MNVTYTNEDIGLIKHISQYSTQELNCLLARHKDFYRECLEELEVCSQIIKAINNEVRKRSECE